MKISSNVEDDLYMPCGLCAGVYPKNYMFNSFEQASLKISSVVENNLCVSCGLCAGVCPKNCISSTFKSGSYLPSIDENSCVNCGLCYKICPGKSADYITPYENAPTDIFFGFAKKCFAVQTKDKEILKQSSSGGVVTTLVKNLLQDKVYDAAFLVDTYNHDAEIFTNLYTSDSDLSNTPKSRYLTVNQSNAVKFMLKNRDKKLILVGTSCFIQGILNVIKNFKLNRENYFLAGLFCDKTMNYNVWNYFKALSNVDTLFFRTKEQKGWPGIVGIKNKDKKIFLPRKTRMQMKDFFCVERCRYCLDKLNQFADISFGDNYSKAPLPKPMSRKAGVSCIIIRTDAGESIFNKYLDKFLVSELSTQDVYDCHGIKARKKNFTFSKYKSEQIGYQINNVPPEISAKSTDNPQLRRQYDSYLAKQMMGRENAFPSVAAEIWNKTDSEVRDLLT